MKLPSDSGDPGSTNNLVDIWQAPFNDQGGAPAFIGSAAFNEGRIAKCRICMGI